MAEYTYADVIIDPNDPRVEIGKEYYFADTPRECICCAKGNIGFRVLNRVEKSADYPFGIGGGRYAFLIRKKEPGKKYVPFDLSKEEDRARLRGAWVKIKEQKSWEEIITSINSTFIFIGGNGEDGIKPDYLLKHYEFVDGTPCGILKGVTDD